MITRIEALRYKCLKDVSQTLGGFQFLVGPNASGKTTFLDVISFLGTLVSDGLDAAISERTSNFQDLLWCRQGTYFQMAINVSLPDEIRNALNNEQVEEVRYEVSLRGDTQENQVVIDYEGVHLLKKQTIEKTQENLDSFPKPPHNREKLHVAHDKISRTVISKIPGKSDNFYSEVEVTGLQRIDSAISFNFGPKKSALGNIPVDESLFPVSNWLKDFLKEGIQKLVLNSLLLRKASAPGQGKRLRMDGANLPWIVEDLKVNHLQLFAEWIKHLRTALPDLQSIRTVERADDKHRYLMMQYDNGLKIPSWNISDGTLRLLALTLPAYLPEFRGVYLIEEPENGIHPKAIETVYKSLSSVYDAQVLAATHSPVILGMADPSEVLCFAKTPEGMTDIVRGSEHPKLREWHGETSLDVLYAAGVLG